MIEVRVGTTDALEVREDVDGNQSVHSVDGERIISFLMPDGVTSMDASSQVIGALTGVMMEIGAKPWWIESNDQAVAANLLSHYGVELNQMPQAWGDGSTTNQESPAGAVFQATAAAPDPQLPSAPVVPPEDETFLVAQQGAMPAAVSAQTMSVEPEPEVVEQTTPTTKTTRTRKKAAAPEPPPEPAPTPTPEPEAEPQPEGDS